MNKQITVSNVKQGESTYGPYLQIGYKTDDGWENYFADVELAGVLLKGECVTIEYEKTKKGSFKITGAAPVKSNSKGGSSEPGSSGFRTPEQILRDGVVQHVVGLAMQRTDLVPDESAFFYWLEKIYEWTVKTPIDAYKDKAKREIDAVDDPDDDIRF